MERSDGSKRNERLPWAGRRTGSATPPREEQPPAAGRPVESAPLWPPVPTEPVQADPAPATDLWGRPRTVTPAASDDGPAEQTGSRAPEPDPTPADGGETPETVAVETAPTPTNAGPDLAEHLEGLVSGLESRLELAFAEQEQRLDARLAANERRTREMVDEAARSARLVDAGLHDLRSVRDDLAARARQLETQLAALADAVGRQLPDLAARQRTHAGSLEAMVTTLRDTLATLDDSLDQGLGALAEWRDDLPATTRRLGAELGRDVDRARERLVAEAGRSTAELEQAARRAEGLAQSLSKVERILSDRLAGWERASLHERRRAIDEVVGRLAEQLPARRRRRIAEQLLERERDVEQAAAAPAPGPGMPPPATERPAAAPSPTDTIEDVLQQIPGVGPTRRRALVQAFGDRQQLEVATIDELAAVRAMSPTLAARVRAHLDAARDR